MAAYLLVNVQQVKDQDKLQEYGAMVGPITEKYGGKVIGASANPEVLEGSLEGIRTLVIEFPDAATLKEWYESDEYQPAKALRLQGMDATLWVVDGA